MPILKSINDHWQFFDSGAPELINEQSIGKLVSLPHNAVDIPLNYFDETAWQKNFCYQKIIEWKQEYLGKEIWLILDGVMADAQIYFNGQLIGSHRDGYTPFECKLPMHPDQKQNLLSVFINGTENPDIPPFGGPIDYLTYAGIYRDAWLKICDPVAIDLIKIEPQNILKDHKSVSILCQVRSFKSNSYPIFVTSEILDHDTGEQLLGIANGVCKDNEVRLEINKLTDIKLWDLDSPKLYKLKTTVQCQEFSDTIKTSFGFRSAEFKPNGFFLNGRLFKIRGLNRHQSFPYVGYAMGRIAQEQDAEHLKYDLGCNLVRTSHYPQSPWFHDHCDRIGLLVFEEIPGWQHIGGKNWKEQTLKNVDSMIKRNWNRPSNILWGVRINESADDHDFYVKTNALARKLDPTRQTGGVRCIQNSELLEDVYTMNDFVQGSEELPGTNHSRISLNYQADITGLSENVPYLVTEFNGHMFPTKRTDHEQRQLEHVIRYLDVINRANGDQNISGCIGWCFADYNTHKDFGSGDHICHHGVLDIFRTPKFASYVYSSQKNPEDEIILKPVTYWSRGERNIGGVLPLYILTNCEKVTMEFGNSIKKSAYPNTSKYPFLDYPPVIFDHTLFEPDELGKWGLYWTNVKFTGFLNDAEVISLKMVADPIATKLEIGTNWKPTNFSGIEQVRVEVKALDQVGNVLPYFDDPLTIETQPGEIIGPSSMTLKGGISAFWINISPNSESLVVSARTPRLPPVSLRIEL